MDASPLVLAQTHARKASKASTPAAAVGEHDLAAGQFATAAKGSENSEAFRTLKLLEQHHQSLSRLLKFQHAHSAAQTSETSVNEKSVVQQSTSPAAAPLPSPAPTPEASPYKQQPQSLPAAHRPQRDVSSSIASNLASARGIPSNRQRRSAQASSPVLAQHQAEGKILSPPRRPRLSETPSKGPSTLPSGKPQIPPSKPPPSAKETTPSPPPKSDEPFNRFYSTFESLFSKLSAPLAFAGLPLTPDEPSSPTIPNPPQPSTHKPPPQHTHPRRRNRASADPDYSTLFSPAALRAVREEAGTTLGAAESFYVVPTTGGTMPYASILARHSSSAYEREGTGLSEEMDEFVDARETVGPPSPNVSRTGIGKSNGKGGKSMEELQLENEGLRGVLDEMSRRLWQFECGAQMGSVALHQSIRASMKRSPGGSDAGGVAAGGGGAEGTSGGGKVEEQMAGMRKEMERMGKENEKLKGVVGRYRERWEKLKEGARVRREGGGSGLGREDAEGE